jgi:hypothetical protein
MPHFDTITFLPNLLHPKTETSLPPAMTKNKTLPKKKRKYMGQKTRPNTHLKKIVMMILLSKRNRNGPPPTPHPQRIASDARSHLRRLLPSVVVPVNPHPDVQPPKKEEQEVRQPSMHFSKII